MFEAKRAAFIYAVSPVHMGAGTAFGLIDNPIQREVHTGHPTLAGAGLKGALRHRLEAEGVDKTVVKEVFGPETHAASLHAGALSVSDAVLVAFPVRSARAGFVYATSALALARAMRVLEAAGESELPAAPAPDGTALHPEGCAAAGDGHLVLEAFRLPARADKTVTATARWLATNALPQDDAHAFFRDKLTRDLVVLPEQAFHHFVDKATVVEPHVRINDTTGTADDGGLFYTENLPPESLLLALAMASRGRAENSAMDAEAVLDTVVECLDGRLIQIGGDATTGRGQVVLHFVGDRP